MAKASSQLEQLHISLSRTVTIRFADQQPLLAELREALQRTRRHDTALLDPHWSVLAICHSSLAPQLLSARACHLSLLLEPTSLS